MRDTQDHYLRITKESGRECYRRPRLEGGRLFEKYRARGIDGGGTRIFTFTQRRHILSDRTSQACVCRVAHDEPCRLFLGNPRCRKATRGHLRKALACHWPERFSRSLHEVLQRFNALATETAH